MSMAQHTPVKIMLVEDDEDCINLTVKTLEKFGILNSPVVARNGKEALEVVSTLQPQIVLLDWVLPDMPGADVLRGIRRESGDIITIVLSAHIPERMDVDGGPTPDYYISKPIDSIQFLMALKSVNRFGFNIVDLKG